MHHQKMIILGLIATGRRYGFEIEDFISRTEMRRWAQIGTSTIYKALRDLDREGAIKGRTLPSGKGPKRTEYRLTRKGRSQLTGYILQSLRSDATARLDRIAGLFFSPLLEREAGRAALKRTRKALIAAEKELENHLDLQKGDKIAEAIIQFYIDVNASEQRAIEKIMELFD